MFTSRLKEMREKKNLSQSQLSEKSGVPLRNIQAYEQGYKDINKAQVVTVLDLADALECSVRAILNS